MLHYTCYGIGDTIILLHGFCENSTCFNRQVFLLKDKYKVITIDLPGHGLSPIQQAFSIADIAQEVKRILDKENISSCVMIGHSMGGYVTLAFAKLYPKILTGIGLLHSTANADNDERKTKRNQAIELIPKTGAKTYLNAFIPPLFVENIDKTIIEERLKSNLNISEQTLINCLKALRDRESSIEWITRTTLPIAFFIGKHDALIPANDMLSQAASAKVAKVIYLENSAHMGMHAQPDDVAEGIDDFVEFTQQ